MDHNLTDCVTKDSFVLDRDCRLTVQFNLRDAKCQHALVSYVAIVVVAAVDPVTRKLLTDALIAASSAITDLVIEQNKLSEQHDKTFKNWQKLDAAAKKLHKKRDDLIKARKDAKEAIPKIEARLKAYKKRLNEGIPLEIQGLLDANAFIKALSPSNKIAIYGSIKTANDPIRENTLRIGALEGEAKGLREYTIPIEEALLASKHRTIENADTEIPKLAEPIKKADAAAKKESDKLPALSGRIGKIDKELKDARAVRAGILAELAKLREDVDQNTETNKRQDGEIQDLREDVDKLKQDAGDGGSGGNDDSSEDDNNPSDNEEPSGDDTSPSDNDDSDSSDDGSPDNNQDNNPPAPPKPPIPNNPPDEEGDPT